MIQEIQNLYAEVAHKTNFIKEVAAELGKSPSSLRNHWFGQFWSIPKEHQSKVKEILIKTIDNQKVSA